MYRLLFVLLLAALSPALHAQTTPRGETGQAIGIADAELMDQLLLHVPGVALNTGRQSLEVQNLKPYLMPVRRVGFRGSEWSYVLASCLEFYVNLNRNYKDNLSPDYINLSLKASGERPDLTHGLRFLATNGTVSAAIMPYDAGAIPQGVFATTAYRIANFLHLFREVTRGREKIFEVRKALTRGNPVIVEMQTGSNFNSLQGALYWEPDGSTGQRHTLLVVGYDETRQAFELQSAFGSAWGDDGYLYVRYPDFEKYALNGYAMVPLDY